MNSERSRRFCLLLPALVCLLAVSMVFVGCQKTKTLEVPDYDALIPLWEGYERGSDYATMSDGVKIAVDYYLPAKYLGEGTPVKKFPVILSYTPYSRGAVDVKTGKVYPSFSGDD